MTHAIDKTGDWKDRLYKLGFDLFNGGERFEAHEEWEAIWLDEPKGHPNRLFLQGLIQVAAAFHLETTKFKKASFRLFRSARRKLIPYGPQYKGVDVAALLPKVEAWQDRMMAVADGTPAPNVDYFEMKLGGRGWHEPGPAHDTSAEAVAIAKAFEQYSSDREIKAPCTKCGAILTANGRRRAPERGDRERGWRVACLNGCIAKDFGEART